MGTMVERFPQLATPPVAEAPVAQLELLRQACNTVVDTYHQVHGFIRYGSKNTLIADDVDLWCIVETMPESTVETDVRRTLDAVSATLKPHLFFMSRDHFEAGDITRQGVGIIENHLRSEGLDPHTEDFTFQDGSLLALALSPTMEVFGRVRTGVPPLDPKKFQNSVELTHQGVADWIHLFAACFLQEYAASQNGYTRMDRYRERLAKTLLRVAFGSSISHLEESELKKVKNTFLEYMAREYSDSSDLEAPLLGFTLTHSSHLLHQEDQHLLKEALLVRMGRGEEASVNFVREAQNLLLYLTFTKGQEVRHAYRGLHDELTSLFGFNQVVAQLEQAWYAYRETITEGTTFVREGELGADFYYVPLARFGQPDVPNGLCQVSMTNGAEEPKTSLQPPGSFIGEISAFFGGPSRASVTAVGSVDAYKIDGTILKELLSSLSTRANLSEEIVHGQTFRALDTLLRALMYQALIMDTYPEVRLEEMRIMIETHKVIEKDNMLSQYYLRDGFLEAIEALFHECRPVIVQEISAEESETILYQKGSDHKDSLYVIAYGEVELLGSGEMRTLTKGMVFGEEALTHTYRTSEARMHPFTQIFEINAKEFIRFINSRKKAAGLKVLPVELMYHLSALFLGRFRMKYLGGK